MASEVICIVDTDGTQSPDYTSLAAAIAGEEGGSPKVVTDTDLVANDEQLTIKCRATANAADTAVVLIAGWTESTTCYINIIADTGHRHPGKYDTNKYRLEFTGEDTIYEVTQDYTRAVGLQFKHSRNADWQDTILISVVTRYTNRPYFNDNILWVLGNHIGRLLYFGDASPAPIIRNNLIINDTTYNHASNIGIALANTEDGTNKVYADIYNNTVIGGLIGIASAPANKSSVKNNLVCYQTIGSHAAFSGTFTTANCGTNASDDTTSTGGTGDRTEQTFTFVDEDNDDFHLDPDDVGAKDYGADLSGQGYSDDIDGEERTGDWDIGCDEYIVGGIIEAEGSSTGVATAAANASAIARAVSSAVGVAVCSIVAVAIALSSGVAEGVAEALGVGSVTAQAAGVSAGSAEVLGVSCATVQAVGASVGVAEALGIGTATAQAVGSSDGVSEVLGVGGFLLSGVGSSIGEGEALGVGSSTPQAVGSSTGVSEALGIGNSTNTFVGSSTGIAEALGVSCAFVLSVGSSEGVAVAEADGVIVLGAEASAAGLSVVEALAVIIRDAVAAAEGSSVVEAISGTYSGVLAESVGASVVLGEAHVSDFETLTFMSQITLVVDGDSLITRLISGESKITILISEESLI